MILKDEDIDKFFKDGLDNFEVLPPDEVWKNISEELNRKKKGFVIIFRRAAAILIIAAITGILLYIALPKKKYTPGNSIAQAYQNKKEIKPDSFKLNSSNTSKKISEKRINKIEQSNHKLISNNHKNKSNDSISVVKENVRLKTEKEQSMNNSAFYISSSSKDSIFKNNKFQPFTLTHQFDLKGFEPLKSKSIIFSNEPLNFSFIKKDTGINVPKNNLINQDVVILQVDNDEEPVKKASKWLVGGQFSPTYSYRQDNSSTQPSQEKGLVTYSGGVNVNYKASERLMFQTGFYFSQMGEATSILQNSTGNTLISNYLYSDQKYAVSTANSVLTSAGTVVLNVKQHSIGSNANNNAIASSANEVSSEVLIQDFNYLELPFILRYKILGQKNGLNVIGGLSTRLLVGRVAYTENSGQKTYSNPSSNLNLINYTGIVGLGYDRPITKNLIFNLEPSFRYHLNSISSNPQINTHLYSFGIFTGILYNF